VKRNPKYDISLTQMVSTDKVYQTKDIPPIYRDNLSDVQKQVITDWVVDSTFINAAARYGKRADEFITNPEKFDDANRGKKIIEGMIAGESLNQSYEVYRGLKKYDIDRVKRSLQIMREIGELDELSDKGFTSVTFNEKTPLVYATPDENDELWIYSSILDEGAPALFIGNENPTNSGFRKEGEILINRKTKYYILGDEIVNIKYKDGTLKKVTSDRY